MDVSNLEEERDQLKGQLQQVVGAKNKLLVMLDALDAGDKHYILMVIPEEEKPCHWYWQSSRNYIQRHLCAALSGMVHMSRLWR